MQQIESFFSTFSESWHISILYQRERRHDEVFKSGAEVNINVNQLHNREVQTYDQNGFKTTEIILNLNNIV